MGPKLFLCTGLAAQMAQKQKSSTTKSPLMQDWVFRLGMGSIVPVSVEEKIFTIMHNQRRGTPSKVFFQHIPNWKIDQVELFGIL